MSVLGSETRLKQLDHGQDGLLDGMDRCSARDLANVYQMCTAAAHRWTVQGMTALSTRLGCVQRAGLYYLILCP
jgi:hypothetical protein